MHIYPELPSSDYSRQLRRRLLAWFKRGKRDLPWRKNCDPYHIWVSEVMLQQTQVATVIPYYHRFLKAFPTIKALAAASEREVLRCWEGLGYYRRARDLHYAAKIVAKDHAGRVPNDPQAFRALPGVGRYMLGAVLSQAFDRRLPIVEANSMRLLSRLFACKEDPRRRPAQAWLWQAAEELLPRRHVGEFNQALMELGSLICTSRNPRCGACPAADLCAAHAAGLQTQIPAPPRKCRATRVREAAVIVRRGQRVLLVQRPPGGRWANLWEFPHGAMPRVHRFQAVGIGAIRKLIHSLTGLRIGPLRAVTTIRHGVTRFVIDILLRGRVPGRAILFALLRARPMG